MNPTLESTTRPKIACAAGVNSASSSRHQRLAKRSHSRLAAYFVFFCAVFTSMAAAATVASWDLPLMLGGL